MPENPLPSNPAERSPAEAHLARLLRLLVVCGAATFERVGDSDALLGPGNLWALLGFGAGELPATRTALIGLLHPDDRAAAAPKAVQAVDEDVVLGRLRLRDGSYRRFRQRTRVTWPDGGPAHVACCLIDVEDIERERDAARTTHQQLRDEAERRRADAIRLVARASHEIRTPLNGVLGLVALASRTPSSPAQQRHLEMAAQSGQALTRVLNDVLDLASLGSAQETLRPEWFDLDALLSGALGSITPQMGWGDFAVVYDYDGDAFNVRADPGRLRQILINLLGNAAKMTRQGHIGLSAKLRRTEGDRCVLRLRVEDTGPGIPPDKLPQLFEPFAMAASAKLHGGTGLGLSIVKTLVAAMGGAISVDSTVGAGTRIHLTFTLPVDPAPETFPSLAEPPGHAWLVYAPPFEIGGEWLARRLARMGWTSELVPSVAAALARASASQPDMVVVAAHSLQSAADISRLASALPRTRQVLVSRADWQQPDIEARAQEVGALCVLVPLSRRDLLAMVEPMPASHSPPASAGPETTAELRGHVLLVDDHEINRLVGESLLADMKLSVDSVASGEAAIAACRERPPDLVLMDVQMAGMSGIDACRQIRAAQQRGELPHFPVVALTADSSTDTASACAAAGMDAVLTKPFVPQDLRRELSRHLSPDPC